jgi:hypothetical protein
MKESNKKNRTKNREVKEKKIIDVPHEGDINESSSNTMSTGGLTSNRYGRERRHLTQKNLSPDQTMMDRMYKSIFFISVSN